MATRVSCGVAVIRISRFILRWGRSCACPVAQDAARNEEPLYFARTLADLADLGVAQHALDRIFGGVAGGTHQLDGADRGPHRELARVQLRHRCLGAERLTILSEPRRVIYEVPRGGDFGGHVRERELHALPITERRSGARTAARIRARGLERALRQPERKCADADPPGVERLH